MVFGKEHYNLGLSTSGEQMSKEIEWTQDHKGPAGKEKSTKVKFPALYFYFEMLRQSKRKHSQLHMDPCCKFQGFEQSLAHLNGSWHTR